MAKKKKKKKKKVKKSRKTKPRKKKRKKSKTKTRKSKKPRRLSYKAPKLIEDGDGKSLIKVSDSWANHAYVNKYNKTKQNVSTNTKMMIKYNL